MSLVSINILDIFMNIINISMVKVHNFFIEYTFIKILLIIKIRRNLY